MANFEGMADGQLLSLAQQALQIEAQALLDMLTIVQHKGLDFSALKVVVVGDILHSRVARSDIQALKLLN